MSEIGPAPSGSPLARGFFFNVNFVFFSTLTAYSLTFLYVVLVSRTLGPEGRGVTALYQAGISLALALLSFGISPATVYFVGRRDLTPRQAVECGLTITIAAIALTAAAVYLLLTLFGDKVEGDGVPYWAAVIAVPSVIQYYVIETVLRAMGRFGARNFMEIVLPVTTLGSFLAIELTSGMTVERAVYAWSLSFLPPLLAGYAMVGASVWPHAPAAPARVFRVLRFGMQAQLGNLIQFLNYRLDQYLILVFVSTAGVGLYSVGVSLSEGMWFIAHSVAIVLTTNLTTLDEAYATHTMPVVCRNTLLVTGLASIAIGVIAPVGIPLVFGADFHGSVVPFLLLLPGTVALSGTKILAAYVFSRGRPMINAAIAFVTLIVTLVGDLVLLPILGVPGAAIAASLAYGTSLALTALAYRRMSGGSILEALVPRPSDAHFYIDGVRRILRRLRPSASRGLRQSS